MYIKMIFFLYCVSFVNNYGDKISFGFSSNMILKRVTFFFADCRVMSKRDKKLRWDSVWSPICLCIYRVTSKRDKKVYDFDRIFDFLWYSTIPLQLTYEIIRDQKYLIRSKMYSISLMQCKGIDYSTWLWWIFDLVWYATIQSIANDI